jgi:hypothetical protein
LFSFLSSVLSKSKAFCIFSSERKIHFIIHQMIIHIKIFHATGMNVERASHKAKLAIQAIP